jgi:hypothetical protein
LPRFKTSPAPATFAMACALTALGACGQEPDGPTDAEAVQARAVEARTTRQRTGAEVQDRALNRVIRAVYVCVNGERLTVDFDNPRRMATVRTSNGLAYDLREERSTSGLWYRSSSQELRGEGVVAEWSTDGRERTTCRAVD